MSKQPLARKRCGAKTRSGKPCKNGAMENGRCRMHGGKSTGAPKNNQNSKKHGFFSRYIPKETLEIMGMLDKTNPVDLIWDQIQIQYAAIIRAQKIMFVESKDEMIKELKKEKEFSSETGGGSETEWEFQFAWDRHASFLNAQSRAMSELRSLIKQFSEAAHEDDARRLSLEQMKLNAEKTQLELSAMRGETEGDAHEQGSSYEDALNAQTEDVFAGEVSDDAET